MTEDKETFGEQVRSEHCRGNVFSFLDKRKWWKRDGESEHRLIKYKDTVKSSFSLLPLCVGQLRKAGYLIDSNRGSQAGKLCSEPGISLSCSLTH